MDKTLWKLVGVSAGNISYAREEVLQKVLKVKGGSVNPFALVNDTEKACKVIIDKNLENEGVWAFHPMQNTATVEISKDDFLNVFLKNLGREAKFL